MEISDLIYLGQRLVKIGQIALHDATPGLQTAESMVIAELSEHRASTISDLAQRTGYAQSRISTAVASLRERGWVNTRMDPTDGRRTVAYMVEPAAEDTDRAQSRSADDVLASIIDDAPEEQRANILRSLDDLLELLRLQSRRAPGSRASGTSEATMERWARELGVRRSELERMTPLEFARIAEDRKLGEEHR